MALDSSTLKGWVNGGKPVPSDGETGWSVKRNSHGKTEYTLGWKLHLLVDCETGLPVLAYVSPGKSMISDVPPTYSERLSSLQVSSIHVT